MQDKWTLFQKFLITEQSQINITDFLINSGILIILTLVLEFTYRKCAKSLSNRKIFSANFLMLAFTTMLIITIVKSSLALALGLVGALSIVRFRAAIKEPEELTYLFFTISVGLGLGANQRYVVTVAFIILLAILWVKYYFTKKSDHQNLFLTISSNKPEELQLSNIKNIVKKCVKAADLKRYDENPGLIEASYLIEINKTEELETLKDEIKKLSDSARITFIDNKTY